MDAHSSVLDSVKERPGTSKHGRNKARRRRTRLRHEQESQSDDTMKQKFQAKSDLRQQREKELAQMCRAGGSDIVVMRKGQYATTYAVQFQTGHGKVKCSLLVPVEYPQTAVKLVQDKDWESGDPRGISVRNFNAEAKRLLKDKQPLVVQLNYLASNWELLQSAKFNTIQKLRCEVLASCV